MNVLKAAAFALAGLAFALPAASHAEAKAPNEAHSTCEQDPPRRHSGDAE